VRTAVRSMTRNAAAKVEEELTSDIVYIGGKIIRSSIVAERKLLRRSSVSLNKTEHEEHEVGEDKFTALKRLMKKLTQI
jgi:hypothetical protein